MAIELKRQSLLDKKKQQQKQKKPQVPQKQTQAAAKTASRIAKKKNHTGRKILTLFFLLSLLAMLIVPKPQLISYKKLNLVAHSIYLPGWFGRPGKFIDSSQRVIINKSLGLLYLCFPETLPREKCNRYQFIEQKGVIPAIKHYLGSRIQ